MNSKPREKLFSFAPKDLLFIEGVLFFSGFLTKSEGVFAPVIQNFFRLNYTETTLIPLCFFSSSLLVAPLCGSMIQVRGYSFTFSLGILAVLLGILGLFCSVSFSCFPLFLLASFFLGGGVKSLIITGSCYAMESGWRSDQSSRLSLIQAFYSLGGVAVPIFFFLFLLWFEPLSLVQGFYLILALMGTGFFLRSLKKTEQDYPIYEKREGEKGIFPGLNSFLLFGFFTLFFYMGYEVCIDTFLVRLLHFEEGKGLPLEAAARLGAYYYSGFALGRLMGGNFLRHFPPGRVLLGVVVLSLFSFLGLLFAFDAGLGINLLILGVANSVMYPLIVTSTVQYSGQSYPKVTGFLNISAVGAALIPLIQGIFADRFTLPSSFLLPVLALPVIFIFGVSIAFRPQFAVGASVQFPQKK